MAKDDSKILEDHKRHKTKFIPPALYMLGERKETSWIRYGLPELFWIGLLNHLYGVREGAEIALVFTKKCAEECELDPKPIIGAVTSFDTLTDEAKQRVVQYLDDKGLRGKLIKALGGLLAYYPECPLAFLCKADEVAKYRTPEALALLQEALAPLFYKLEKEPVFTQATYIYLGFVQGKIFCREDLPLAKFPEIEKYPETELSQEIASGVRAMVSMQLGGMQDNERSRKWSDYFWNRGLQISPCTEAEEA